MRLVTAVVSAFVVGDIMPHFLRSADFLHFGIFALWSGLGIYMAYVIAGWSALFTERSVDTWSEVSYIKLNRADEVEIAKSEVANRNCLLMGGLGLIGSIGVNVAVAVVATVIASHL